MERKLPQWEAVDAILAEVRKDPAVVAAFVKGAMAYGETDLYSDVDFYCLVKEEEMEGFLARRIGILERYQEIVYWSEANFVGPQIVAVFANGLHFDLYTVTESGFPVKGEFMILHDPEGVLPKYQKQVGGFELEPREMEEYFGEFSFCLVEFEAAWKRGQMLFATRLIGHCSYYVAAFVRQIYDAKRARIGSKKLELYIPEGLKERFYTTLKAGTPEEALTAMLELVAIFEEFARELEGKYELQLNWRFFEMMKERLMECRE